MNSCSLCILGRASEPERCPFHDVDRPAGTLLLKQGEIAESILFVKKGLVLLSATSPSGEERLCAVRGPNTLLGLEALRGQSSDSEAWSLSDVVVCKLDLESFRGWVGKRESPMGAAFDLALDEALRRRDEQIALSGKTCERLARFLLERVRVEGRVSPLDVEQQVLARMLGMRAETLSRAVAQLKARGALAPSRGIRIIDIHQLAMAAGEEGA